jgi:hypothetical protein
MKGNTPLEVMAAIVANGGPVSAWVKEQERDEWSDKPEKINGCDLGKVAFPFFTNEDGYGFCSLTNPHPQYKPIPTEWTNDWAECRAVDADGRLWEYENIVDDISFTGHYWYRLPDTNKRAECISKGHDPTNWKDSLEQRTRKMRPMTPLEGYEFLAEGHEGKPRVWRYKNGGENHWIPGSHWGQALDITENKLYANLSDRDVDTLTWREFPLVEDN